MKSFWLPLAFLLLVLAPTTAHALHFVASSTSIASGSPPIPGEPNGAQDLTFDAVGNIYAVGELRPGGDSPLWVGKFNRDLVLLSSATIFDPNTFVEMGRSIAVDSVGDVWITGSVSTLYNGNSSLPVAKFSSELRLISSRTFETQFDELYPGNVGLAIMARPSGGMYIGGYFQNAAGPNAAMWLQQLDPNLQLVSSTTLTGGTVGINRISALALDADNDIWAVGKIQHDDGGYAQWLGQFNPDLTLISSRSYNSGSPVFHYKSDVAISTLSSIWTIGDTGNTASSSSTIWVTKNSPSLELQMEALLSPVDHLPDYGDHIIIDHRGYLWMSGRLSNAETQWLAVYDSDLTLVSSFTFSSNDGAINGIGTAPDGSIWGVGWQRGAPTIANIWLSRLAIQPEQIVSLATATRTSTAIRWIWPAPIAFPADSYQLFQSSSGILVGTSTGTVFDYIGLATNTAYGLRVAGVNPSGQGELSSSVTAYTLAALPGAAGFAAISETSLQTNWTANDNPPGTAYTVLLSTGTAPATNGYSGNLSSTTFNLAAVFTGLSPGQVYFAEVRALNGDGVPTAYTSLGSTSTTGLAAPTGFAGTTLGISSISWSWGNVAAESGFRVVSSTDGNMSGNLPADTLAWTEVNLATNTAHTRSAVAFAATDTSTSAAVTRWTLALPPTGTTLDAVYNSSIAVSWQANTNPAGTLYQVLIWKTGTSTATWEVTATSVAVTGLTQNSTYYLAVRAVNGDAVQTSADVTLSTLTLDIPIQQSVDPGLGGTIVFIPPSGTVSVNIPPQAFQQAVNVTIQTPDTVPVGGTQSTPLAATGVSIELTLDQPVQPVRPVSITVSYRDSDIIGLDETRLILARYDTLRNVWVPLLSTVDSGSNRVVGRTDHFSLFQIMQASPAGDVQSPRIFPNPLRPSQGHTSMTFMNLPAYCRVRIYTVVGELVKELQTDAAGMAAWDGTNESGRKAASGVYYVLAQGNGQSNTFKVAIQR